MAKFCNGIGGDKNPSNMLFRFQDHSHFKNAKWNFGFLSRTMRSFYRELCYFDCLIPVWLSKPPQVWVIE